MYANSYICKYISVAIRRKEGDFIKSTYKSNKKIITIYIIMKSDIHIIIYYSKVNVHTSGEQNITFMIMLITFMIMS